MTTKIKPLTRSQKSNKRLNKKSKLNLQVKISMNKWINRENWRRKESMYFARNISETCVLSILFCFIQSIITKDMIFFKEKDTMNRLQIHRWIFNNLLNEYISSDTAYLITNKHTFLSIETYNFTAVKYNNGFYFLFPNYKPVPDCFPS